jgi:uncharacterized protein involved in exopolysaccharide biosynthesis
MVGKEYSITNGNSDSLRVFFYGKRKTFLVIAIAALIISVVVSLLIQDKYKSSVILFPTTTSSISKAILTKNVGGKEDVLKFGEIEEAEQLIQILKSDEIRNRIIEKYNLLSHYDIDEGDPYKYTNLKETYEGNISFQLTKYMAVEIEVLDHDKDTAALIANDISELLDTVKNRMRGEIASQSLYIVEQQYKDQKNYIKKLEDSLIVLSSMGVVDYESQAERITEQLSIAILQGKKNAAKELQEQLDKLGKYGGTFLSIKDQLEYEVEQLTIARTKYKEAKVDAESILQHKFIVNKAFAAEKKSYPIRWLIVVMSVLSTLLFTTVILLIIEKIKPEKH